MLSPEQPCTLLTAGFGPEDMSLPIPLQRCEDHPTSMLIDKKTELTADLWFAVCCSVVDSEGPRVEDVLFFIKYQRKKGK